MKNKIENIFKLISTSSIKFFFYNDILQIIYSPSNTDNNKDNNTDYPKINIKTDCELELIIGFSMNLKSIDIKCGTNLVQLDKITCIDMNLTEGDIIEFIPGTLKYCEIYIKFKNILYSDIIDNVLESSDISYSKYYVIEEPKSNKDLKLLIKTNPKSITFNRIIIVLTKFIKSIGEYFKIIYKRKGIECEIKTSQFTFDDCLESINNPETIYLILFNSNDFNLLPNRFIFYQIEQMGSKFLTDKLYLKRLKYMCRMAEQVWTYSDIVRIIDKYCSKDKIKWIPMPFVYLPQINLKYLVNFDSCVYDIFFYGHPNDRRKQILNELTKHFGSGIKIGYGYYDEKKISYIARSKIILNIHYYEKSGLETCRINEILNLNKIVISENSPLDKSNMKLYSDIVVFVDKIEDDMSNMNLLIGILKQYLNKSTYLEKIEVNKKRIKKLDFNINKIINDV